MRGEVRIEVDSRGEEERRGTSKVRETCQVIMFLGLWVRVSMA